MICSGVQTKPRSLHRASQRSKAERKKKPGRFGREDKVRVSANDGR